MRYLLLDGKVGQPVTELIDSGVLRLGVSTVVSVTPQSEQTHQFALGLTSAHGYSRNR